MKTLEYLRGIAPEDCRRLRARGIRHTNQLLHACTLAIDRRTVSRRTGISPERLLEFAHQCALLEISGMEPWLPVVRRLGVGTLRDLAGQDPEALWAQVVEAAGMNAAPNLPMVQYWVSQARLIDMIELEADPTQPDPSLVAGASAEANRSAV